MRAARLAARAAMTIGSVAGGLLAWYAIDTLDRWLHDEWTRQPGDIETARWD